MNDQGDKYWSDYNIIRYYYGFRSKECRLRDVAIIIKTVQMNYLQRPKQGRPAEVDRFISLIDPDIIYGHIYSQ